MEEISPFIRLNDEQYDVLMAEKFYVLTNIDKVWGWRNKYDSRITKVIFRDEWHRMDIEFTSQDGRSCRTAIGEFLGLYNPEGVQKFNANLLFTKEQRHYGVEYSINVNQDQKLSSRAK